jgi:ribosomal protein L29
MKKLEIKELENKLEILKKDLANLQVEVSLGKVKNLHNLKDKKKDIARVMTLLNIKLNQEKVGKNQKVEKIVMKKKEAKNGAH